VRIEPTFVDSDTAAAESVEVRSDVLASIEAHARRESPNECCGLLIGTDDRVVRCHPARNELASPTRYRVRPEDHFAAIRAARAEALHVVGAYHSHPASPAVPSAADLQDAIGGGFLYLIAGVESPRRPAVRGWRLRDGNFVPVRLVTVP
jgi:proteasome lid subunit RPN8/RPN11